MKCFVTGAVGFIGNALAKRLVEEGYEVKCLVHTTKPQKKMENVEYVKGDVTSTETLKKLLNDVDVVYHCAAYVKDYGPKNIFYKINVDGTKNLVKASQKNNIKKFVFLSHIQYESNRNVGYYSKTKALAEQYLIKKHRQTGFPVVIIRPGNVYGPGATTWVLRPLQSIQKNKISLIDNGSGIFLHTYIENLVDVLIAVINNPHVTGEVIETTDGDHSVTWGQYLNDLAAIAGRPPIKRNMSKSTALVIGRIMMLLHHLFKIEPWVTPPAVHIFSNKRHISIEKAEKLLNYKPRVDYKTGIKHVKTWLEKEQYI